MIGDIVKVTVDRPLGSFHPKHKDMYYPVNYGYIKGIIAPDGEEQDAWLLIRQDVNHPKQLWLEIDWIMILFQLRNWE